MHDLVVANVLHETITRISLLNKGSATQLKSHYTLATWIIDLCLQTFVTQQVRIMQIIRGGKLSRVHALLVIRWKSFAIVWPVQETPYYKKEEFTRKLSQLQANPRKPRKFSTTNHFHYTV